MKVVRHVGKWLVYRTPADAPLKRRIRDAAECTACYVVGVLAARAVGALIEALIR